MLGWINDCIEKLVIDKFGVEAWHIVKQKAGCTVCDGGFFKLDHYTDQSSIDLVMASSEVSGLTFDQVLEAFGAFFVHYIRNEGYDNLLCCQGSTLKDWMDNINAIHHHLQTTFPKKMIMPQFWCEDASDGSGALMLHYHSKRGSYLAPLAKGLVAEIAKFQFQVEINMKQTQTQGEDGAGFTSWFVTAVDPTEMWKLTQSNGMRDGIKNAPTALKCPFTGMTAPPMRKSTSGVSLASTGSSVGTVSSTQSLETSSNSLSESKSDPKPEQQKVEERSEETDVGLSSTITKKLFPYHIIIDDKFEISQVGQALHQILRREDSTEEPTLIGKHIAEVLEVTQPMNVEWNWTWMRKLEDQSFQVEPSWHGHFSQSVRFKASVVLISHAPAIKAMIIMAPDAKNLDELMDMNLTLSDLPVHGDYRDAVFLREHLSHQMNNALKMEKLSKSLTREKELLESLLPTHAAEGLRSGKAVEPMLHQRTTFFFSDIVGFTKICKNLYPWDVIDILNRLYCVMDFLAKRFDVFKVETIGDAYVCCSGLPTANDKHAMNVANFAIAVNHCCQQVLTPVEKEPIQLRIGIHSGSCASGVVGMTNPRYCVFGDTVNTCSRHESTGEPGKIHCSKATKVQLELIHRRISQGGKHFSIQERGLVNMKGKGKQLTYWVTGTEENDLVNTEALAKLDIEVKALLAKADFDSQSRKTEDAGLLAATTHSTVPHWASTSSAVSSASSIASSVSSSVSPILTPKPTTVEVFNQELEKTGRRKGKSKTTERRIRHPLAAPFEQSHEEAVVVRQ
jgi:guanylate cyclase soluble subunit beta